VLAALDHAFEHMRGDSTGHDPDHLVRVFNMAKRIGRTEGAEMERVELVAALHDVEDFKFTFDEHSGSRAALKWLSEHGAEPELSQSVARDVAGISFKGAGTRTEPLTLEGMCVQDADRLDALGAIGIARCFAYGGAAGRPIHDPEIPVVDIVSTKQYLANKGTSINHFYEKLLLLKDRMNTEAGRSIARERHEFVESFLSEFLDEWG